jgi:hypothetical protein
VLPKPKREALCSIEPAITYGRAVGPLSTVGKGRPMADIHARSTLIRFPGKTHGAGPVFLADSLVTTDEN